MIALRITLHHTRWFVYTEEEEIENLISSLNRRGFRESKLYDSLTEIKSKVFARLKKCPLNELYQNPRRDDVSVHFFDKIFTGTY